MADTIFDAPNTNPLEELVGEGKKFQTVEQLASAKLEADRTIQARNEELERHREEIRRQAEEIEAFKRQPREPLAQEPPRVADRPVEDEPNKDLASRIREEIRQAQEEDIQNQNIRTVAVKLSEVYGSSDKAREVVAAKASELGLSVEFLQSVAAKSPKAFFTQLGLTDVTSQPPAASRSDVNTVALGNTSSSAPKQGSYKSYEQLRQDNPKRYFSAEIQNQMFADAKRLGDAFFQ